MEFDDLVHNLEKLIELPLQPLSENEKLIFVKKIERVSVMLNNSSKLQS